MLNMAEKNSSQLIFFVNGKKITEPNPKPEWTLLYYLRNRLHLTGTKLGCAEGGCGACTVMLSRYDRKNNKILNFSANACLAPLCAMHGFAVTTVEGIGSTRTKLHPVQERIAKSHGSQCGFCTPGIVMSMYALLRNNPQPSVAEVENAFDGNLCRCTGYRPILDGFKTFTKDYQCPMGEQCCKTNKSSGDSTSEKGVSRTLANAVEFSSYDPTQELIFPNELQLDASLDQSSLHFSSDCISWYRPTTLSELLQLKKKYPEARLVVGNTEVGIEMKFKNMQYPVIIAPSHIVEMNKVEQGENGLCFGGSVTLSQMEEVLKKALQSLPEYKVRILAAVVEMLRWFAGHQIRNVAAIAGNIMTASPISDLNPLWLAAGCVLTVTSQERGNRNIKMDHGFFLGYRRTVIKPDEVLVDITIPFTKQNEYFFGYKQAHRRDDDIAIVNAGMRVEFDEGTSTIRDIALAYGGMAPITVMATKTMNKLIGKEWGDDLVTEACLLLAEDLPLPPGVPGGSESYRRTLTTSFFFKFYLSVLQELHASGSKVEPIPNTHMSVTKPYERSESKGSQVYQEVAPGQLPRDPVGRPIVHTSAFKQATGEAKYCDDMPAFENELYLALVMSTTAHAKILEIDPSAALKIPGVFDFICHKDVPGSNKTGTAIKDEEIFASEKVTCQGQFIGAILAENQSTAQQAAKAVKIKYEELDPIITIEQAIEAKSFMDPTNTIRCGDVDAAFASSAHVLEGEVRIGGQEHFYLEAHACICVPKGEDGEMEVFSSTQSPTTTQMAIADSLGVSGSRIVCRTKRMGGGFGGKESRSTHFALPVAIAAHKHQRPVRCMCDRDEDMVFSGTRHPFLGRYKVGFSNTGVVQALSIDLYANCGNSLDLSAAVVERALLHVDNCYKIPNVRVTGYLCKTNIPSNTAFRGFGGPQSLFVCEYWMTAIANYLGIGQDQVRELNMYKEGDRTHFSQVLTNCTIRRCWDEVKIQSDYTKRKEEIMEFNRLNRWKKRGIAINPVKFGIAFTIAFLNQAGALVHIYTDGSVLLTHGGTEMGQGLHTKMIQIASRVLQVPADKIFISETSTDKVPNTSATAASASSDLNGMAVMNACQILIERLEPFINDNPKGTWEDWVKAAYFATVSLSAAGFYNTPDLSFNREKNEGNPFNYFSFGAAVSEVEIDCLTGDHTVLRTDMVMDVGNSINPAIDVGQIEGAFMQGYGLFTLEEQRYSPQGFLYTRGPGAYKIPSFSDIPIEMNVSLLKGESNPRAIYSSKAVGEPPLFLASSVFFAIKDAITAARLSANIEGDFLLNSPATAERIRLACVDQFTKQFPEPEPGTYKPWNILL